MSEAWIIDACRTPRGIGKKDKGSLAHLHPQHLGATVLGALAKRNDINTAEVDDIIFGTSWQRATQGGDLARMSALTAGYDVKSSAVTIDRFCGSGISSVTMATGAIMSGMEDMVIAGGCEMMSLYGADPTQSPFMDNGNLRLRESHAQSHQGLSADAIATLEKIDREDLDQLALVSQKRAHNAIENGYFEKSLVPVYNEDGSVALDKEEFPRPKTTLESLSALKPSFEAIANYALDEEGTTFLSLLHKAYPGLDVNYVHHAGNSSGVVDGAAAILLTSPDYAKANGMKPRAKIKAYANIGDSPALMLNAPGPAAKKVLKKSGMELSDIDLFEVNEAFAVVTEKFIRDLDIDRDTINVNGGAMALGHPIGATGSVLIGTALDELERRDQERALITMCAAGGMAPAIIIERV